MPQTYQSSILAQRSGKFGFQPNYATSSLEILTMQSSAIEKQRK